MRSCRHDQFYPSFTFFLTFKRRAMASGLLAVVSLVLLCISVSPALAVDDAFLVVHKEVTTKRLKAGEEITVSFSIYNVGGSTAYDLTLTDDEWPAEKFDLEGNSSTTWSKMEAGSPRLQHSFLLRPKEKGNFTTEPAVVKYRVASSSDQQLALSTPTPELDVLSDKPQESQLKWVKDLLVKFGPLASCILIVALFAIVLTTPTRPKRNARANKKRR
eukprot:TRINITY_DN38886_c0_g1_i1.p1 TRINITY_DN38886_c0_g1~~TRINITY_DN38886_c0_g1_i1.p1  ORF type:complete len:217 (-),score=33.28 TRINITY_DN38886_c0_g1_i1:543-1193(-)